MASNQPIGIFDSGVGGLSILKEVKETLPLESFIFLADQDHVPYGVKTKEELEDLSERITKFLLNYHIKLLVVACNTATCYVLDFLRLNFDISIIGVVPAVKPASEITVNGKIAVMSTPATAESNYLSKLVKNNALNQKVLKVSCDGLEESVEELNIGQISNLLDKYTLQIAKFGADVVVLGCTHYPFLKKDIRKRLSTRVKIIDSGKAIAKRVKTILKKEKKLATGKSKDIYFTTADPLNFSKVASALLKYKITGQKAYI